MHEQLLERTVILLLIILLLVCRMISGFICNWHLTADFLIIVGSRLDQAAYHLRRLIIFIPRSDYFRWLLLFLVSIDALAYFVGILGCCRFMIDRFRLRFLDIVMIINEQSWRFLLVDDVVILIFGCNVYVVVRLDRACVNVNLADLRIIGIKGAYIT